MANTKVTTRVIADDAITSDKLASGLTLGGDTTLSGHVSLADSKVVKLGDSADLQIRHDGTHSLITNTTGNLYIQDDGYVEIGSASGEVYIGAVKDGAVNLRYDNDKRIETSSGGVTITGTATATTFSGALSGTIASATTATTQSASDNTTKVATTAYVTTAVSNLVDSSPSALNTLNELAAALGDDANFSTTVTNSIATKLPLAGGTLTGTLNAVAANFSSDVRVTGWVTGSSDTNTLFSGNATGTIIQTPSNTNNAAGSFYIRDSQGNVHFTLNTNTNVVDIAGTINSGDITVIDPVSSNFNGKILIGGAGSNRRLILEQNDVLTYRMGGTGTNSITQLMSGGSAGVGSVGLTLDASQNATFAGSGTFGGAISSAGVTSTNSITMNAGNMTLNSTSDGNQAFRYYRADGTLVSQQYPYNNRLNFQTYNNQGLRLKATGTGQIELEGNVVINEDSADVNFRVESNGNQHALHVEGDSSRFGVGIAPARNAGHVVVNGTESGNNAGITYYQGSHATYRNICSNSTTAGSHRYWHVKTNIRQNHDSVMLVARFHGYAYGSSGYPIEVLFSGYNFTNNGSWIGSQVANLGGGTFTASQYYSTDDYVVLVLDYVGGYYTGVVLDIETPSPAGYGFDFKVLAQGMSANSTGLY